KAFPPPGELAQRAGESAANWRARLTVEQRDEVQRWRKSHRWQPNQLRHTYATEVRRTYGLEAAQVLLGHSKADTTETYAGKTRDSGGLSVLRRPVGRKGSGFVRTASRSGVGA